MLTSLQPCKSQNIHTEFRLRRLISLCAALLFFATAAFAQAPAVNGVPPSAKSSGDLTGNSRWRWTHDRGTPGTAVGSSDYPVRKPSLGGSAREFHVSYWRHGGERYSLTFDHDTRPTHFIYDAYVYLDNPSQVRNVEMDMNQVIANGKTVIFGTQCSAGSGTWEFTTAVKRKGRKSPIWHRSNLSCNPQQWAAQRWHHVQIAYHRNSSGVVTYDWVRFNGTQRNFRNAAGDSALALRWNHGDLLLNFQLDGARHDNGSMKAYVDHLKIYHW